VPKPKRVRQTKKQTEKRNPHCWKRKKIVIEAIYRRCGFKTDTRPGFIAEARRRRPDAMTIREAAAKAGVSRNSAKNILR